ncbi:sigma-70 family RNA polymerase sigma factor [Fulvivirga sp.]|uniref:RNA polymerase sigma factor n=1 Tax=Fulvivirga sp. TaxID=1931237 RepID=UPI0032ED8529
MTVNQLTDEEVIDKILGGNADSFSILVDRYKDHSFTLAYNVIKDEKEAEDIAQEAFIKAYKNLKKFNRESKFSTWLYRITFNTALTANKKKKKYSSTSFDDSPIELTDSTRNELEYAEKRRFILQALDQLNEQDNVALTLFYLKELSLEEICEVTGMSLSTLKVRLHRARKRMAVVLNDLLKGEVLNL